MVKQIRFLLLTISVMLLGNSWAITNQELNSIYNSISKNQTLTLNAELSNAYLKKDLGVTWQLVKLTRISNI